MDYRIEYDEAGWPYVALICSGADLAGLDYSVVYAGEDHALHDVLDDAEAALYQEERRVDYYGG